MKIEVSALFNAWVEPAVYSIFIIFGDKENTHISICLTKEQAKDLITALEFYTNKPI